ncbi:uncharacterized protein LOC111712507 [Eurytemora carolleeae]|uniref:uncharacterized protein LOC111712507 n=1 Tax=Eurytemora carolleeae TaxID=1294199 RepID=UPI000C79171F|nr:uncharacterized protein LOC111712507 [Eurytemora carolleeae]|eukprot:XP_023342911.1 uncharacterized protein LOC111712507 [Eurytemora affinis]
MLYYHNSNLTNEINHIKDETVLYHQMEKDCHANRGLEVSKISSNIKQEERDIIGLELDIDIMKQLMVNLMHKLQSEIFLAELESSRAAGAGKLEFKRFKRN